MKYINNLLIAVLLFCSCSRNYNKISQGIIPNACAEESLSYAMKGWTAEAWSKDITATYDYISHEGKRSLLMYADRPAAGRWMTKVQLKPWSKYRFSGWVKTENLAVNEGKGAGFSFDAFGIDYPGLTGTNDWTMIEFEFETGNDDSSVLSCMMNVDGEACGRAWFDDMSLDLLSSEEPKPFVTINLTETKEPMSEYIYGQFIEHLGKCIYGGVWAEMIEDRKFWYAPGQQESSWQVNGNKALFSVDKTSPFVGEQTPVLTAETNSTVSIRQSGLGLKHDLDYNGHIVLKATPGIKNVNVTLNWGEKSETVTLNGLTGNYASYPLAFRSGKMTHDASIEIEPSGNGKVWIGTVSLMPSDNMEGFRCDVIALLRELNSPVYRWPGGNFVSGYNWKDGIGDRDKRPPRKNPAWKGVEHNDVGIHEFMTLCRLLNTEPYIAVNAGLGDSEQAKQEVEYCNGSSDTPMGRLRSANGQTEPWNVKWWSIGNEMFGDWQLGFMSTGQFVKKHNAFAEAMRSVDPGIKLIAVGELGDWDRMVLTNCSGSMDLISEHFYRQDWHGGGLMTHVKQIPEAIREKAEAHRKYRKEIAALAGKDIRICMDEWNYWYGPHIYGELGTRYFMRDAMGIAAGIKTNTTSSVFDATGQVLKLYRQVFGTIPVTITGETRPLDIAATLNEAKDKLTISVINPTWDKVKLPVELLNGSAAGEAELWQVTAPDDMAFNEPGRTENVRIEGPVTITPGRSLKISPASINIFVFSIK